MTKKLFSAVGLALALFLVAPAVAQAQSGADKAASDDDAKKEGEGESPCGSIPEHGDPFTVDFGDAGSFVFPGGVANCQMAGIHTGRWIAADDTVLSLSGLGAPGVATEVGSSITGDLTWERTPQRPGAPAQADRFTAEATFTVIEGGPFAGAAAFDPVKLCVHSVAELSHVNTEETAPAPAAFAVTCNGVEEEPAEDLELTSGACGDDPGEGVACLDIDGEVIELVVRDAVSAFGAMTLNLVVDGEIANVVAQLGFPDALEAGTFNGGEDRFNVSYFAQDGLAYTAGAPALLTGAAVTLGSFSELGRDGGDRVRGVFSARLIAPPDNTVVIHGSINTSLPE